VSSPITSSSVPTQIPTMENGCARGLMVGRLSRSHPRTSCGPTASHRSRGGVRPYGQPQPGPPGPDPACHRGDHHPAVHARQLPHPPRRPDLYVAAWDRPAPSGVVVKGPV
jgi:hypothetical protein